MTSSPERLVVAAGRVLYRQGEKADRAYLVLSGVVELQPGNPDGVPVTRGLGEIFGELALVDDSARQVTALAVSDCELLAFTSGHLLDRIEAVDPLLRIVLSAIIGRYSETVERVRHLRGRPLHPHVLPVWTAHSEAARHVLSFDHALRRGLERDEFDLHFQPIVRLATGRLAGVEALIRWQHPERGFLLPNDFIPFAESIGVISEVTDYCLRKVGVYFPALRAAAAQNPHAVDRLYVSVNVSGIDLAQSAFASKTASILCDAGIDPGDVRLEVTESILMQDAERCVRTLQNCRDQGFAIAIDDFGTGYSSLHYLNALPIAVLKMDRSFCQSLLSDVAGGKIIAAILHLARELGLSVIAEGVETTGQRDRLHNMGCESGQGYLFGPALSHADTVALVASWRAEPAASNEIRVVSPAA